MGSGLPAHKEAKHRHQDASGAERIQLGRIEQGENGNEDDRQEEDAQQEAFSTEGECRSGGFGSNLFGFGFDPAGHSREVSSPGVEQGDRGSFPLAFHCLPYKKRLLMAG